MLCDLEHSAITRMKIITYISQSEILLLIPRSWSQDFPEFFRPFHLDLLWRREAALVDDINEQQDHNQEGQGKQSAIIAISRIKLFNNRISRKINKPSQFHEFFPILFHNKLYFLWNQFRVSYGGGALSKVNFIGRKIKIGLEFPKYSLGAFSASWTLTSLRKRWHSIKEAKMVIGIKTNHNKGWNIILSNCALGSQFILLQHFTKKIEDFFQVENQIRER